MSAVMIAPMGMAVARGATMTKGARPIRGHHEAAAWLSDSTGIDGGIIVIGIIIIIRVVVVIDATDEHPTKAMPVSKPMMSKPMSGKSRSPCDDGRSGTERTAANGGATVTATTAIAASAAAVSAAHFNRQFIGGSLARSCTSRIDWRQRVSAWASDNR